LNRLGRILGVDVGSIRVGLARTDLLRTSANPIGTFTPEESFAEIRNQIENDGPVYGIVVGWPLNPQGEPTHATPLVTKYLEQLKKKFRGIKLYKFDERYTSKQAMKLMVESGVPKKKRQKKGRLDQAAAALILNQFLEAYPDI